MRKWRDKKMFAAKICLRDCSCGPLGNLMITYILSLIFLLQTLILAKVTPRSLKNTPSPDKNIDLPSINQDPLSSNIYGVGERIILSWLNHHYETYRERIWTGCTKGKFYIQVKQRKSSCHWDMEINNDPLFKSFRCMKYIYLIG